QTDAEPDDRGEHRLATSDPVADGAGGQGADHDTDHGVGTQGAGDCRAEGTDVGWVVQQCGQDRAVDDEIITIEEDGDADDGENEVDGATMLWALPDIGGRGGHDALLWTVSDLIITLGR